MERRKDHVPPANWQDFEDLCLKLWRSRLIDAKKHGRAGQPQAGVDIFGRDPKTETWCGIQCKQRGRWPKKTLTVSEIETEIEQAEDFVPTLSHFIVATTAPRDVETQKFVRELSDRRRAAGKFSVDLFAWDDLQDWLREGPEPISREKALWVWRQRILRLHSHLMPYFQERSAPLLEHVYVELQLGPERLRGAAGAELKVGSERRLLGQRLSIREVLELDPTTHPWITCRWLLHGDPGSGKTTLLRHLAWALASSGGEPWVPVFESLPRLMLDQLSIFGRIEEDLVRADQPGAEIRRILEEEAGQGRLLFLLDGLDEVPREARDRAEALLGELAARWPKSPIVATTRPIGAWSPGPEFLELEVLPFDAERRRAFLERCFGHEGSPDVERAASVAGLLEADRGLRDLASNPLYLTLLALLIQGGEKPSRYRSELYDQIFDLLEEGRHHKPPTPIRGREVAHDGLRHLAFQLTEANRDAESAAALEARLLDHEAILKRLDGLWRTPRRYLEDLAEKTGILGPYDGPEADWRFWHRTFREALTAEKLVAAYEKGGGKVLCEKAKGLEGDLSRWAEPYALAAGRVPEPDRLVLALVKANRALGLRAVATAQGLQEETLREILELSDKWYERQEVYERLPELIDDPIRALALIDRLRQQTRNGNDLFFLEQAVVSVGAKWPEARKAVAELTRRLYDHIPQPPKELFRWIDTPLDGQIELWREIPAGEGWIGAADGEENYDDERPRHRVMILRPFWMAAVPVTNAQYAAFDPTHQWQPWTGISRKELAQHPVSLVTWYAATAFNCWLSTFLPGARLPTEEEWEVACRAGTETRYWSGEGDDDLKRVGWYNSNSERRSHRVGEKPANAWGLYDVHGNVLEWTMTKWSGEAYRGREGGFGIDPAKVEDCGSDSSAIRHWERVNRGGSFLSTAPVARSSFRDRDEPYLAFRDQGFRVMLPTFDV